MPSSTGCYDVMVGNDRIELSNLKIIRICTVTFVNELWAKKLSSNGSTLFE